MSRLNGIKCDWCGATAELKGDQGIPRTWSTIVHLHPTSIEPGRDEDLCADCTDAAAKALHKAKKYRRTGRVQR